VRLDAGRADAFLPNLATVNNQSICVRDLCGRKKRWPQLRKRSPSAANSPLPGLTSSSAIWLARFRAWLTFLNRSDGALNW
jgi:hypothetical protein